MDVEAHMQRIFDAIDNGTPICELMRADERALGHRVVTPGEVAWLPAEDWDPTVVVSIDRDRYVRLVAILARNPGNGAFRRLIAAISATGMRPSVVLPTRELQSTLRRWGWKCKLTGPAGDRNETWFSRP
jgi:hypothetical protein